MKLEGLLVLVLMGLVSPVKGQFTDDFSDGNLDGWEGDVTNFTVNAGSQLQLNAPSGSTMSWLHVPVPYSDSMVWELYFKLDFAPSTSNQLRLYLGLNSSDLATATGYFLEIGASGDQDALDFKYLNSGSTTLIASSAPGIVAAQPAEMTIRVIKNSLGEWQFYQVTGTTPQLLFTTSYSGINLSLLNTFGFYCKYTDTRRDKFFFDNLSIDRLKPDNTPPQFVSLNIADEHSVELVFDEAIDNASAQQATNYSLSPGNTHPDQILNNGNTITLTWNASFVSLQPYVLTIAGLTDHAGNVISTVNAPFTYILISKAQANELLITEIMADPTPTVGLPDAEYLEVYNHSTSVFRLSDYTLTIGASQRSLPDSLIYPDEFVILCDPDFIPVLSSYGRIIGVANMPTLTNTGSYLAIKNLNGDILHDLTYDVSWYADPDKSDGGWSLEIKNPNRACSEGANWAASGSLSGGTPGHINSNWDISPDTDGPSFVSIYIPDTHSILLHFDEKLDGMLTLTQNDFMIDPPIGISTFDAPDPSNILLGFDSELQPGITYRLFPFDAYDCLGNVRHQADTIKFGLIVDAQPGDLLINELLFNPQSGGSRFIEVINPTGKYINLNTLAIGRLKGTITNIYPTGIQEVLGPGEIAAFTPDRQDILSRYTVPKPGKLYEASLPSWDSDRDNASLLVNGVVIDSFTYSSAWHHPVIADQNGVSLERSSVTVSTTLSSNWHSASSLSGYATPTGENSQRIINPEPGANNLYSVTNRNFSPDDDGFKDFLTLQFTQVPQDNVVSVWIYDRQGREVRRLISNELAGVNSLVTWDGRDNEGHVAEMGIYVLFIRLWDLHGNKKEYQESCALIKRS